MPWTDEVRVITVGPEVPPLEAFAVGDDVNWITCRERFAVFFTETTDHFWFVHHGDPLAVSWFLERTEEIIRESGQPVAPTVCGNSNVAKIMWVQPSLFWRDCFVKRSLFTILLQCGSRRTGNYQKVLFNHDYAFKTHNAVARFLFGFTRYAGVKQAVTLSTPGWVSLFHGKTDNQIRSLLVRPECSQPPPSVLGDGSLWS